MIKNLVLGLSFCLLLTNLANAQLYRCTINGTKTFQSTPCGNNAAKVDEIYQKSAPSQREVARLKRQRDRARERREGKRLAKERQKDTRDAIEIMKSDMDLYSSQKRDHFRNLAVRKEVAVGMPKDLVIRAWGEPKKVKQLGSNKESWFYRINGDKKQLQIYKGVVSSLSSK